MNAEFATYRMPLDKQVYHVVVAANDEADSFAGNTKRKALELAGFGAGERYEYYTVEAHDPGSARLICEYRKGEYKGTFVYPGER
jgi:hypothetical protein